MEEESQRSLTKLTDEIRQLERLLEIKDNEILELQNIQVSNEKEVHLLRDNKQNKDKDKERINGLQDKTEAGGATNKQKKGTATDDQEQGSNWDGIKGTYSEAIAIRHLQNRNSDL